MCLKSIDLRKKIVFVIWVHMGLCHRYPQREDMWLPVISILGERVYRSLSQIALERGYMSRCHGYLVVVGHIGSCYRKPCGACMDACHG